MIEWSIRRVCVALGVLALGAGVPACSSGGEEEAVAAADAWLVLIDSGELSEGWRETASLFRKAVTEDDFGKSVGAARQPLGKLVSRKLRAAQATRTLPGAPRGRYVVIQYDSVFENSKTAIESVTEVYEDGEWRVSGYRNQ